MLRAISALLCGALTIAVSFNSMHLVARAADDCAMIRSQLFGTGPSDLQSAVYKYKNYKTALARAQVALKSDESELDSARNASGSYYLAHGGTHGLLEYRLHHYTERVREDRANVKYFSQKLTTAGSNLQRLQSEYKKLGCGGSKPASTSEDWAGTYVDTSGHKLVINGSGATFAAETAWTGSGTQGGTSTLSCTAHASTASCRGSGSYFDDDKTIEVTLETTLSKSGSTIRQRDKILTASCAPKKVADCKDLGYTPAVHAGAEFTVNVRRE